MNYTPDGSPIIARQNAPYMIFILILFLIAVFVFLIWIISKVVSNYINSPEYQEKQKNRKTTLKDIKKLQKEYNFPKEEADLLFELCQLMDLPNITYTIKDSQALQELFKTAYFKLMLSGADENKLNLFFRLNYSIELISAKTKSLISTKQIQPETIVFFIADNNEQFPFTLKSNKKDYFELEVPKFFYELKNRPELLHRLRFTFKTANGLSHNFISRIVRYQKNTDGSATIFIAHSDKIVTETHRHFRRQMFDSECTFSAAKKVQNPDGTFSFTISEKKYDGTLSNISGGGCCIKTNLPIQEKQHLALFLPGFSNGLKITGIIKGTRKLPGGFFALHIQFLQLSVEAQNRIFEYVYNYKL